MLRRLHGRFLRATGAFHPEVLVLDLTHACNSRCVGCAFREAEPGELPAARWAEIAREAADRGFRELVVTGGEPLAHPEIEAILPALAAHLPIALNTNGLLLARRHALVADTVTAAFVSLDGEDEETYRAIRGVRGLELVLRGVGRIRDRVHTHARVTLWAENADRIEGIAARAREGGFHAMSVLAPDVTSEGFGHRGEDRGRPPRPEQLPGLRRTLAALRPFLVQSDASVDRVLALLRGAPGPPRCLAPWTSALVTSTGALQPCFFLPGEATLDDGLTAALRRSRRVRRRIDPGTDPTCRRCVCWRG